MSRQEEEPNTRPVGPDRAIRNEPASVTLVVTDDRG
jgi:hypothetical protein